MRMIERDAETRPACRHTLRDLSDATEVLAPHVDVHLEARQAAMPFAGIASAQVEVRDLVVRQAMAVDVIGEQLAIECLGAEAPAPFCDVAHARLVAAGA